MTGCAFALLVLLSACGDGPTTSSRQSGPSSPESPPQQHKPASNETSKPNQVAYEYLRHRLSPEAISQRIRDAFPSRLRDGSTARPTTPHPGTGGLPKTPAGNALSAIWPMLSGREAADPVKLRSLTDQSLLGDNWEGFQSRFADMVFLCRDGRLDRVLKPVLQHQLVCNLRSASDERFRLELRVNSQPPHGVTLLRVSRQYTPDVGPIHDWAGVDELCRSVAPAGGVAVAKLGPPEVGGGIREWIHRTPEVDASNIASLHKLWTLASLVRDVDAGNIKWTDTVLLQDRHRSPGMGDLASSPAGGRISVQQLAAAMIGQSDNTAADHLLGLLGRDAVWSAAKAMGVATETGNQPLLSTREATVLTLDDKMAREFVIADATTQRQLLNTQVAAVNPWTLNAIDSPGRVDRIGWFATPEETVHCLNWLLTQTATVKAAAPLGELLSATGVAAELLPDSVTWAGFKGGTAIGVRAAGYLLRTADGNWLAIAIHCQSQYADISQYRWNLLVWEVLRQATKHVD